MDGAARRVRQGHRPPHPLAQYMALRQNFAVRLLSTTAGTSEPRHATGTPRRGGTVGDAFVGTSPLEWHGSSTGMMFALSVKWGKSS